MGFPSLAQLALAGVISLIAFLGYGPQYLFHFVQPGALDQKQSSTFNLLLFCTWCCYARACFTDPGHVPRHWENNGFLDQDSDLDAASQHNRIRWCRKCENRKPPRAHHCRVCQRYFFETQQPHPPVYRRFLIEKPDVYQRWTITVPGPSIASPFAHFPTSSVFSSTPSLPCCISNISSGSAFRSSSRIALSPAYVFNLLISIPSAFLHQCHTFIIIQPLSY